MTQKAPRRGVSTANTGWRLTTASVVSAFTTLPRQTDKYLISYQPVAHSFRVFALSFYLLFPFSMVLHVCHQSMLDSSTPLWLNNRARKGQGK